MRLIEFMYARIYRSSNYIPLFSSYLCQSYIARIIIIPRNDTKQDTTLQAEVFVEIRA